MRPPSLHNRIKSSAGDPPDVVVCVGTLIKGETMHFEYICDAVSKGIMQLGLDTGVPVIFGVLTCLNDEQAIARAGLTEGGHNHGTDWGTSAVEMARIKKYGALGAGK